MRTGFTRERIEAALARSRAFWRGERGEPMVSVYTPPTYRQSADDATSIDLATASIQADGASGEADVLPCYWPDFGTISTAKIWGGRVIPPEGERKIHIEPAVRRVSQLGGL